MNVQVNEDEDTEWNDILRAHGIIPERPPSPTAQLEEAIQEALVKSHENRLENKDLDELAELEDEEDEEFLNQYKQKRLQELNDLYSKSRFGSVIEISKPDYKREVTDASESVYVFVHLYQTSSSPSRLLAELLSQAAVKFPEIKFVKIVATRAVENYPDRNVPTLLVYHKGDVVKQYITLSLLGGMNTKLADLEDVFVSVGAVKDSDRRLERNKARDSDGEYDEAGEDGYGRKLVVNRNTRLRDGFTNRPSDEDGYDSDFD